MDFNYDKLLGKNIRRIRKEKGWTQEQMSARLQTAGCDDITRSALAKIEAGQRHIYSYEIKIIKTVLGISYNEFFI